jgi:hypothetical protein
MMTGNLGGKKARQCNPLEFLDPFEHFRVLLVGQVPVVAAVMVRIEGVEPARANSINPF